MTEREIRDFVRATLAVQYDQGGTLDQAKAETARMLACEIPSEIEFNEALALPGGKRRPGRPRASTGLPKREAVAAVAVYFETCGAKHEQAILMAGQSLGIPLSRKVAKEAVAKHRLNTAGKQIKLQAQVAYAVYVPDTTLPLPEKITPKRKPRQAKF